MGERQALWIRPPGAGTFRSRVAGGVAKLRARRAAGRQSGDNNTHGAGGPRKLNEATKDEVRFDLNARDGEGCGGRPRRALNSFVLVKVDSLLL